MRWADERYVRVYTRDTGDWLALGWQAQAMFLLLLRKADRAGILATGRGGIRGLAALAGMPVEVAQEAVALLLEDGCLRQCEGGGYLIPNFIAAQEARASDKARQQKLRETARDVAASHVVTIRDQPSQNVTASHTPSHAVTDGHGRSRDVTPSLAVPSRAVLKEDPAAQVEPAVAVPLATKEQGALFPTPAPEKPKRPPTAVAQWVETAVETRKSRVPPDAPQDVELKRHQWPKLGEALKTHGALTLTAAFGLFLAAPGYPQEHAYPMGLFVSQVDEWVSRAQAASAKSRLQTPSGGDRPRLPPREAPPESTQPAAAPRRVVL
jgi:hypothetical protein